MLVLYGWIAAGATAVVLSALLWNAERRLDNAQAEIVQLTVDVNTAVDVNQDNQKDIDECKAVNVENARKRDNALLVAQIAVGHLEIVETELERLIDDAFETDDTECRLLDDSYPVDFVDWMCIPEAENCRSD